MLAFIISGMVDLLASCRPQLYNTDLKDLAGSSPWHKIILYVTLSHFRSKGNAIAEMSYCTGSGMLMRYLH